MTHHPRMTTNKQIPAIVLGGTGYVSGELLRLLLGHPNFALAGVMSDSAPGELAGKSFPHLAGLLGDTAFRSQADIAALIASEPTSAAHNARPTVRRDVRCVMSMVTSRSCACTRYRSMAPGTRQ